MWANSTSHEQAFLLASDAAVSQEVADSKISNRSACTQTLDTSTMREDNTNMLVEETTYKQGHSIQNNSSGTVRHLMIAG
jgi:hypothetical protein